MRKKGKPFIKLWKKKPKKTNKEKQEVTIKKILEAEEKNGKGWVEAIYKANKRKLRKKEGAEGNDRT